MGQPTYPNGNAGRAGETRPEGNASGRALATWPVSARPRHGRRVWHAAAAGAAVAAIAASVVATGGASSPLGLLLIPVLAVCGAFLSLPALATVTVAALAGLSGAYRFGEDGWPVARMAVELPLLAAVAAASYALLQRARKRLHEEQTLAGVRRAVSSSLLLDRVYAAIHEEVARLIPVDRFTVSVALAGSDDVEIVYAAGAPIAGRETGDTVQAEAVEPGWSDAADGRAQIVHDVGLGVDSPPEVVAAGLRSGVRAPLGSRSSPSGYIIVRSRRPRAYTASDCELLARVAAEVVSTIENARYHAQVVRAAEERVRRMRLDAENRALEEARRKLAALNEQLEAQNRVVRASRERLLAADEAAKRAIAEELHGTVQTKLLVLWASLGRIRDELGAGGFNVASVTGALDRVIQDLDHLREEDIRLLSHRLHPNIVRVSAVAGLRSLRDFYENHLDVDLQVNAAVEALEPPGDSRISEPIRLAVHRVADAALGNVLKHAEATRCVVRWEYDEEEGVLRLAVTDDGKGFAPDARAPSGLGLVTIGDYVDVIGGRLSITSFPGKGTRLDVEIPFREDTAAAEQQASDAGPDAPAIGTVLNVHWAPPTKPESAEDGWSEAG